MEKLTLEHIAPYGIGHKGLKFKYFDDERVIRRVCRIALLNEDEAILINNEYEYVVDIKDSKPILRRCDLTKPITVEGKEIIPILELGKLISNNFSGGYTKNGNCYSHSGIYCLEYVHNSFIMHQVNGGHYCGVLNQLALFKWLYKHKFDVDGLIEKGLAIDVNTLEVNPYE